MCQLSKGHCQQCPPVEAMVFFFKPLISLQGGTTFARDLNKIGKRLIVENKRESYPLNIVWM